jgi:hypothetical protein
MAGYQTDLVLLGTGGDAEDDTNWLELANPYNAGGTPALDTENFIQGSFCVSQSLSASKTGAQFSIVFDAGSDISGSFAVDDVIMTWVYFGVGTNLDTFALGGHRFVVMASTSNGDSWNISGNDRAPNPYGGWWNAAVDPTLTPDDTIGAGSGGVWQYFGAIVNILATISKGTPHAVDAQRFGRGELYATGDSANFTDMAAENDAVANRWGLFQDTGGDSFLWKGLMSLGQVGTGVTFLAENQNIKVDDANRTYRHFNRIELKDTSSSVTWNNINFAAAGTGSPGQFDMVDNCGFIMNGGAFNNMDTFVMQTGAVCTAVSWNGCGQVTNSGATFDTCNFAGYEGAVNSSYMIYNEAADPLGEIDGSSFTMGTVSGHAIEFGTSAPFSIGLTDITFAGYSVSNNVDDSAVHILHATGQVSLNVAGGAGTVSYRTEGATVSVINSVTISITTLDASTSLPVVGARLSLEADAGGTLAALKSTTITTSGTTATATCTAHGMAIGDSVIIRGANEAALKGTFTIESAGFTANVFTYTITSISDAPGTGTITSTAQILAGLTDSNGLIEDTGFNFGTTQPILGRTRKGTNASRYQSANIIGEITSDGFSTNISMIIDE